MASAGFRDRGPFRIAEVEVRPASNELVVGGTPVRIKPRMMDVLLRLAATPGDVVTRDALIADAWPRRMVNDEVLSRVVADLRAALRDDAREARFIETLPKAGYRLVAPVAPIDPAGRSAPSGIAPKPASGPRRIALAGTAAAVALAGIVAAVLALKSSGESATSLAALTRQLTGAEPFSSGVELEVLPRFSPDGSRVAFAAGIGARAEVVVREVRSANRVVIGETGEVMSGPVFFPDGERIAFFRQAGEGDCGIDAMDLRTRKRERLVDCSRSPGARFDLSADGRTLVYSGTVRPQFPVGLVARDLASGKERTLTSPAPDQGSDVSPRFSPDGGTVAFLRGTQSSREVWTVALAEGAEPRNAGSPRGPAYGIAWLGPQGPLLVGADWFGQRALNRFDLATHEAAMAGGRGARSVDVDRAGNIVFENAVYSANLFLLDPSRPGEAPRELWPSTRYTNQPELSPDGRRALFVSNREGAGAVYVAPLDGAPRRLLGNDEFAYMRPHWSRDGKAVHAVRLTRLADGERVQEAVRVDVDSGAVEVLAAFGKHVFDVRESDDGTLVAGELAGNAARLLRAASSTATPERLPLPLATEYQVAGGRIAFMQPNLIGLTLCDLRTLRCEPLDVAIDESNRFDWFLAPDAVWHRTLGTPPEVARYDLGKRAITWRHGFSPTAFGLSLAASADGKSLLVAREAPPVIDLLYAPVARK
ncbi:MAG: LpqB family beta-propeller domain-containing protein [Burkholderiales bacterium]